MIEEAKRYAKSSGKSLSSIVEGDFTSYKELIRDALIEKFLGK